VAKSLVSDISSVPEYIKGMPDRFVRSITASKWEETNKGSERIPISYVDTSKSKDTAEIASRSRDLVKITEIFAAMAIHYKHFANAKDVIDMGQSIIREIDRTRMKDGKIVDEQGRVLSAPQGLKNALDALQYMKEYVMFKRAKALEGNTNLKIYSLNPAQQKKIADRVKELVIQRKKLEEQLLSGDIDGEQYKEQTDIIDAELTNYDGKPIYGSKVGDKLISIAQAKALSFNPFSAVANFTFGVVSSAIFANGRTEFDNKQFRQSLRIMMKSTGKWLSFGSVIPDEARKIMNVMDRLGVMGDVVESSYGKLENRQRIPNWKKTVNPYNWLRSGDYFCRGLNTVAVLLKQKVKVTEDGADKEISVWEALDNDGNWNEARYGKRPEWFSENVEDQQEWTKLRDKVARVNMIIMGNVDKVSPKMANKWIIGRLLGQFRLSWLPEGWYNRWAEEKYDVQLQRNTKGRFTTYKDLGIGGSLRILLKQYTSIIAKTDPFTGEHKMNGEQISTADIENMRKNFAEINFYLMVLGAILMLKSLRSEDDDDESQALQILLNMVIRMKQDVAFYSSPEVFDTVTRNAVPSFGVIKDYTKLMKASWEFMTEDDYTADRWLLKLTKAGLPIPQATLVNKIKYMTERDLDDLSR
jgi:type VI protein secretion system component Hcp